MDIDRITNGIDRDDLRKELAATARGLRSRARALRRAQLASDVHDEWGQEQVHVVARAFEAAALRLEQVGRLPPQEESPASCEGSAPSLASWEGVDEE